MIDNNDCVYKAHENCTSVIKSFTNNNGVVRARLYCCEHHKWLYTLTLAEESALRQVSPELFVN